MTQQIAMPITMNNFWVVDRFEMRLPSLPKVSCLAIFADAKLRCLAIDAYPMTHRGPYIESLKKNVARYGAPKNLIVDYSAEARSVEVRHWAAINQVCICFEHPGRRIGDHRVRQILRPLVKYLSTKPDISNLGSLNRAIRSWLGSRSPDGVIADDGNGGSH